MSTKSARWLIPHPPASEVGAFAHAAGIGIPTARIFWKREIRDAATARAFLHPKIEDLHSPFGLAGMFRACERLVRAIRAREKVLLYGDYDVDGTTAIVILHTALRLAGADIHYHVPHRIRDGYGMRSEVVEQAKADGVQLIVSVDTGIRAGAVVEHANTLGIDVIVTDHHLPEGELPPAVAVVNPNRRDCRYADKNLCGAAVAWKLAEGLLWTLEWPPARRQKLLTSLLKLVAIATVADVVPLTGENRILVKHGLEGLRETNNPGLKAILKVAGIKAGETPSARQVGFQIGPRLNAAGRMDDAKDVIELFLTQDDARAQTLAEKLDMLNRERQETEANIREQILAECGKVTITDADAGLVFSAPGWHQGVIGIVAGRLAERYCRPVFVLTEDPETGDAHGSGRGTPIFHLLDAMESMPDLFTRFGGHRQAAGLKMKAVRVAEFRQRFAAYAAARLGPEDLRPVHDCDAAVTLDELTDETVAEILALAPFGNANPAPLLALNAAEVARTSEVKNEKHLFLHLRHNGATRQAKGWSMAELADNHRAGDIVDAAVFLEEDAWSKARGGTFWGLVLKDVRATTIPTPPPTAAV
ncbi:MAG: single-stranded-DNA-specific exonuclease RecJ [Bryobacteraceae bacterium]